MSRSSHLSLNNILHVRQSGMRSINVEADVDSEDLLDEYILTSQARSSLERMLSLLEGNSPARSWTLTGPYGSGKSYYGLFLMRLMGPAQQGRKQALHQLQSIDSALAGEISQTLNHGNTMGLFPVPITGFRSTLQECLKHGLNKSLSKLRSNNREMKLLLKELEYWSSGTESRAITQWFYRLTENLHNIGYLGTLMVFDEMGKPLEYAASHPENADIYLLQELAEFANRSGSTPFVFLGILHQSFERYAVLLDSKTQREWAKIQGRFEDIPFQESPTQQLRLLGNTIEYLDRKQIAQVLPSLQRFATKISSDGWCPPMMKPQELVDISLRTYPFHPTALVSLPYLFRRLAQNERSVFAYLASHEPAGFQEFLSRNEINSFICLADLFDYLSINFQGRLYATGRARAITETIDRLSNISTLSQLEVNTLKTIGMLNWLSEVSHLQASETSILEALISSSCSESEVRDALKILQNRSLIVYRRFNNTYSIWQGSDVDIEERLQRAHQRLSGSFSIAEAIQKYLPPRPIVARRHSYEFGTVRYFEVRFIDSFIRSQVKLEPPSGANGIVLVCLSVNFAEIDEFVQWATSEELSTRTDLIIGIFEKTGHLIELLSELRALYWVQENTGELHSDSVARRELRSRLNTIETLVQNEIERTLSLHRLADAANCQWLYRGGNLNVKRNEGLSHLLSKICDVNYSQSPKVWNEIVNRRNLSSQGAAARRNLIDGMLNRSHQMYLGIEGFPPERSMYDSILRASGLHRKRKEGGWGFAHPKLDDPLQLAPVWRALSDTILNEKLKPVHVHELFQKLNLPPFGVTYGVLPILLCAFMMLHRHETTLYREGSLLPEASIADWEVLLRRPELFSVAGSRVTGTRRVILERFARGFRTEVAVLPVVREVIKGVRTLPSHTLLTQKLSQPALAIRTAALEARGPEQLLFHALPIALEIKPFEDERLDNDQVELFFSRLNEAFAELIKEMPQLINTSRDELLFAFGLEIGPEGWDAFRSIAREMSAQVTNQSLVSILKRACETPDSVAALESVLAQIANRPPRSWTDRDTEQFSKQVKTLGTLFQKEYNSYAPERSLSAEQLQRSQKLVKELRSHLQKAHKDDPKLIKIALQMLIREYLNETEMKK